jgi:hypothetical protein
MWLRRSVTPEHYFSLSKKAQADLIWDALFIQVRTMSTAAMGPPQMIWCNIHKFRITKTKGPHAHTRVAGPDLDC